MSFKKEDKIRSCVVVTDGIISTDTVNSQADALTPVSWNVTICRRGLERGDEGKMRQVRGPVQYDCVLTRRGDWDTCTEGRPPTRQEERGLGRNQPCRHLPLGLPASALGEIRVCRTPVRGICHGSPSRLVQELPPFFQRSDLPGVTKHLPPSGRLCGPSSPQGSWVGARHTGEAMQPDLDTLAALHLGDHMCLGGDAAAMPGRGGHSLTSPQEESTPALEATHARLRHVVWGAPSQREVRLHQPSCPLSHDSAPPLRPGVG